MAFVAGLAELVDDLTFKLRDVDFLVLLIDLSSVLQLYVSREDVFGCKGEVENRTHFVLGSEVNNAIEILNYHFTYHETKSNTIGVDLLLLILVRSKQLEHVLVM